MYCFPFLQYLLCGLGEIDEEDWRKHTNYRSGYHDKHFVIQWFWKVLSSIPVATILANDSSEEAEIVGCGGKILPG